MKFNFLVLYGLILMVSISSGDQLLNLVYSQSDNASNPANIDTEVNNLLNKVGRGNIIDSTIDSLMQGMGSSPSASNSPSSSNSSPSSISSSSSSSLLSSLLPPSSSSSSSSPPTSRITTNSSDPNSSAAASSSLNSLIPPPVSSSSGSTPPDTSSKPNTSNVVNSEIRSILKNQDSSQSSVTVNQVKNQNMKYYAKIVDKKSNNEDIISSNSFTEFNNELLKFCLESGLDSYACSSIIQDSLQSAQFTSSYMGPATVNTDLIGYSLELKIK